MFALECRCARHIFRQWQKECCHGNGILWQKWGKILRRELLPQFFTNSHEIWHRCLPWGVDVQDTFFDSDRKCVAMVTAYYGKNGGKILRRELLPQFFTNSHEIWHRCLPWGVDVQDIFLDSGRKCVAMVTAYYGKNGKNLASRTTSSVFHQFSWNLAQMFALRCRCARHIFWQW